MATVTLAPFAAGRGSDAGLDAWFAGGSRSAVPGSRVGGSSDLDALSDGSDASYLTIEGGLSFATSSTSVHWNDQVTGLSRGISDSDFGMTVGGGSASVELHGDFESTGTVVFLFPAAPSFNSSSMSSSSIRLHLNITGFGPSAISVGLWDSSTNTSLGVGAFVNPVPNSTDVILTKTGSWGSSVTNALHDGRLMVVAQIGYSGTDAPDDYGWTVTDAWFTGTNETAVYAVTPVWADFVLPPEAGTPSAVAVRVRAETPAGSLANDPGSFRDWVTLISDTSWNVVDELSGGDTPLSGLELVSQSGFADFDYWYGIVDPVDHTDNGDWFEFAANGSSGTTVAAALTGSGLRVTVFMDSWNTSDPEFVWAYLSSLELLVETDGASAPVVFHAPVLRVFPRSDGRGASSAQRVWPRPPTGTYGRVGPGSLV